MLIKLPGARVNALASEIAPGLLGVAPTAMPIRYFTLTGICEKERRTEDIYTYIQENNFG
jgi:hypothetical protein